MNIDWQMIAVGVILAAVVIRIIMGIRDNLKRGKGPVDCAGCPLSDNCGKKDTNDCNKPSRNKNNDEGGCGCGCH